MIGRGMLGSGGADTPVVYQLPSRIDSHGSFQVEILTCHEGACVEFNLLGAWEGVYDRDSRRRGRRYLGMTLYVVIFVGWRPEKATIPFHYD
jgi:hypothetical protein